MKVSFEKLKNWANQLPIHTLSDEPSIAFSKCSLKTKEVSCVQHGDKIPGCYNVVKKVRDGQFFEGEVWYIEIMY